MNDKEKNAELVIVKSKTEIIREYLDENSNVLHALTKDLKEYWEHLGLMTDMTCIDVLRILDKTICVKELESNDLDSDLDGSENGDELD